MTEPTSLKIDRNGFLTVDGVKAPFKYDRQKKVIQFKPKDRRAGKKKVEIKLEDLSKI